MLRDNLGVPMEPPEQPHILIAQDWRNHPIYSDDNDDYIEIDGEYILDDPDHIRAYLLKDSVIKNTMQIWKEQQNGKFI